MLKRVFTVRGSGFDAVRAICRDFGARLMVVKDLNDADEVTFEEDDGLMLLGGADIAPRWYGEVDRHCYSPDRQRDIIEWTLVRKAFTADTPTLGICRGHQMIAVASGGALCQDIYAEGPSTYGHHPPRHKLHTVDERLERYLPSKMVNSSHHQAVREAPAGFEVLARTADLVIESIWREGVLGVQWHPESLWEGSKKWGKLFSWFFQDYLM